MFGDVFKVNPSRLYAPDFLFLQIERYSSTIIDHYHDFQQPNAKWHIDGISHVRNKALELVRYYKWSYFQKAKSNQWSNEIL